MSWEAGESWERAEVSWEAGESWEQARSELEQGERAGRLERAGSKLKVSWSKGSKLE